MSETLRDYVVRVLTARLGFTQDTDAQNLIPGRPYLVFHSSKHPYNYYVNTRTGALRYGNSLDASQVLFEGDRNKLQRWLGDVETFVQIGFKPTPPKGREEEIY